MTLDQQRYYLADCDVRLDRATGLPLDPQPDAAAWAAWDAAGQPGPETDHPTWAAIGRSCSVYSERINAPSPAVARRQLMNAGWKVKPNGRRLPPRTACPDHREVDL